MNIRLMVAQELLLLLEMPNTEADVFYKIILFIETD